MVKTATFQIRCSPEQLQQWHKAAKARDLPTAVWARILLNANSQPKT